MWNTCYSGTSSQKSATHPFIIVQTMHPVDWLRVWLNSDIMAPVPHSEFETTLGDIGRRHPAGNTPFALWFDTATMIRLWVKNALVLMCLCVCETGIDCCLVRVMSDKCCPSWCNFAKSLKSQLYQKYKPTLIDYFIYCAVNIWKKTNS